MAVAMEGDGGQSRSKKAIASFVWLDSIKRDPKNLAKDYYVTTIVKKAVYNAPQNKRKFREDRATTNTQVIFKTDTVVSPAYSTEANATADSYRRFLSQIPI